MTHFEIRRRFLDFFARNGHIVLPGSPLAPKNDPSLLFVNAGMNQFKDVFLGLRSIEDFLKERGAAPSQNIVTAQKCMRAGGKHNDLEAVGKSRSHHTLFEMLGNFSFGGPGGYFKETAIDLAWRFLTRELGLSPERLWVSVHKDDKESYNIWREAQKIPEHKIYLLGDEDNFWRMGQSGPCGPCAEIHYYNGKEKRPSLKLLNEIWNLVFMEFYEDKKGERKKLPRACVDTGMGLERLCALLQNKSSNYHTDLFQPVIQSLERASGCQYDFKEPSANGERQKAFRVLADHSRAVAFLINEGVLPASQKAGYVLRRIMRRAFYYGQKLHPEKNLLFEGVKAHLELMAEPPPLRQAPEPSQKLGSSGSAGPLRQGASQAKEQENRVKASPPPSRKARAPWSAQELGYHPELKEQEKSISSCVSEEAKQFFGSLREGKKRLEGTMAKVPEKRISKDSVFLLCKIYDDIDEEAVQKLCRENSWQADVSTKPHRQAKKGQKGGAKRLREITQAGIKKHIPPKAVWELYSVYGFPEDLTRLIARERAWSAPTEEEMREYKKSLLEGLKKSADQKGSKLEKLFSLEDMIADLKPESRKTAWTAYSKSAGKGILLAVRFLPSQTARGGEGHKHGKKRSSTAADQPRAEEGQKAPLKSGGKGAKAFFIMDKTCFYPEGGGPLGDKGLLKTETGTAQIIDCQKKGDCIIHSAVVQEGEIKEGQVCHQEVFYNYRYYMAGAHTATHLLNSALREVLGLSVRQAGSMVQPGRLRFDFTWPRPLTQQQIQELEEKLWRGIEKGEPVVSSFKSFQQAKREGALFLKEEGYTQEKARVISIGEKSSKELCGGVHVANTALIESFKIISEKAVQSGVRRITAYTGFLAKAYEAFLVGQNAALRVFLSSEGLLKQKPQAIKARAFVREQAFWRGRAEQENPFLQWMSVKEKELKALRKKTVRLEDCKEAAGKASFTPQPALIKERESRFHPLARQTEELREFLKLQPPMPIEKRLMAFLSGPLEARVSALKEAGPNGAFAGERVLKDQAMEGLKAFFEDSSMGRLGDQAKEDLFEDSADLVELLQAKARHVQSLDRQWASIKNLNLGAEPQTVSQKPAQSLKERLTAPAEGFEWEGQKGRFLVLSLPVEDRKILADMSDTLLLELKSGVLIIVGQGEAGKRPALVHITKNLSPALPAGAVFKNFVARLCGGSGGGKPSFAQGSIKDISALPKLKQEFCKFLRGKKNLF